LNSKFWLHKLNVQHDNITQGIDHKMLVSDDTADASAVFGSGVAVLRLSSLPDRSATAARLADSVQLAVCTWVLHQLGSPSGTGSHGGDGQQPQTSGLK